MNKKVLLVAAALLLPFSSFAADLANGQKINKSCALCHGVYGQGASGKLSPRIAGLPKEYIIKSMTEYRDEIRFYPLMVKTSGIDKMTEAEMDDVATYLSTLDLSSDKRFDIASLGGNHKDGKGVYKGDCKTCHAKDGYGKPRKGAPPLAGQQPSYLFASMLLFKSKNRLHDNDDEDETFDDYNQNDMMNLTAYISEFDDSKVVEGYSFVEPKLHAVSNKKTPEHRAGIEITDIQQTVVKMALEDGVGREEAIMSMNSKAIELNLKIVGQQNVSKELESRGVKTPYLAIMQYCDPMDARTMIIANPIFSSYMPCRISMVEDQQGKTWLMMLNLDMLINSELLPDKVVETATRVNQSMLDIMVAGASGDL